MLPVLLAFFLFGSPQAPPGEEECSLDDQSLERSGAVIGEVTVVPRDVFDPSDPKENNRLFRLANRLHRDTRERVVRRQLLFAPGDLYSRRLLEESERILRANRYFYDATVRPVRCRDGRVDVEVVTRDVWTLNAGAGFSRSGGENTLSFEVQDTNLFGWGKDLAVEHHETVDRTTDLLRYRDPALAGSRVRLEAWLAERSDGHLRFLDLQRPFYALDTRWAAGIQGTQDEREDPLYDLGREVQRFGHRLERFEVFGGRSAGLVGGFARRWTAGFTYRRDRFFPVVGFRPAAGLPEDRTLSYPWIGFELLEDRFLEEQDLDQIARTEDVALGLRLNGRLGWSSSALGGDRDRGLFSAGLRDAWTPGPGRLLLASTGASGRWGSGDVENLIVSGRLRAYWRNLGQHLLFATLEADLAEDLDRENQLLLGGDTGLRGYPLRYQDGDRRVLLTVEQRFYTDWHVLRLVYLGGAVFFDAGRAWFAGRDDDLGVLKDAGIGLRLSSSRSGLGAMVHLDLAFPLDGDDTIERVQWLVSTRETF
ncbi:MAG TPA: POTRA domain-containing protein [Thermoanaerobaculia bacterium]